MARFSVIFLGTSAFAVPSLEALLRHDAFDIHLVITQPDKPVGRKQLFTSPPVKVAAEEHNVPVWQPATINKEFPHSQFAILNSQFLVVVSYGQILSPSILDWPGIAPVNLHASLLPRWRGASPIQHAILAGDSQTGVTVQRMVKELDAGPLLGQVATPVLPRDTTPLLHDRLAVLGAELLVRTLLEPLHPVDQDLSAITICHKLTRTDGIVDPATMGAEEIDRKVLALHPWPGVTLTVDGQPLKILRTEPEPQPESTPLPCAHGTSLHLVTVQPAGKKPMSGAAWARGRKN